VIGAAGESFTNQYMERSMGSGEPGFEGLEARTLLSVVTWDGGGGDLSWHNPLNWSGDALPGPGDDVVIEVPDPSTTITLTQNTATSVHTLVSDASIAISAGTVTLDGDWAENAALTMSGGHINGAGHIYLGSDITWTGGTIDGTGQIHVAPGGAMVIDGDVTLGRSLINNGYLEWASGSMTMNGSRILNQPDRSFVVESAGSIVAGSGFNAISNLGTVNHLGSAASTIGVWFNSPGAVEVNAGTLTLAGGVQQRSGAVLADGTWTVDAGATLNMQGSLIASLGGGATVQLLGIGAAFPQIETLQAVGAGATLVMGGGRPFGVTAPAAMSILGRITLDPGVGVTQTVTTAFTGTGEVDVESGTVQLSGALGVSSLHIGAGAEAQLTGANKTLQNVSGLGLLRIGTQVTWFVGAWTGGQVLITAPGSLRLDGAFHTNSDVDVKLLNRRLVNYGTINWVDVWGSWLLGMELVNRGTLNIDTPGFLSTSAGLGPGTAPSYITNYGTIIKSGIGDATLRGAAGGVHLANLGTVHVMGGRLIASGGGLSNGQFIVDPGAEMVLGGLLSYVSGATFSGAGRVRIAGPLTWTNTNANMTGDMLITAPGVLTIAGAGTTIQASRVTNQGLMTLLDGAVVQMTTTAGPFTNSGILVLGVSSLLNVHGNVALSSASWIQERVGSASLFGQLHATGSMTVAGSVNAVFQSYQPGAGVTFDFLTYGSETGTFAVVVTGQLPPPRGVQVQFLSTTGRLRVV
jgi:hypothetical protein